jgi:hypothetical protein
MENLDLKVNDLVNELLMAAVINDRSSFPLGKIKGKGIMIRSNQPEQETVNNLDEVKEFLANLVKEKIAKEENIVFYVCKDNEEILLEEFDQEEMEDEDFVFAYSEYKEDLPVKVFIGVD